MPANAPDLLYNLAAAAAGGAVFVATCDIARHCWRWARRKVAR